MDHVVTNASSSSQFWSSVVYFRRQWSCDQNAQKRQKSCDESRVQNPQSCVKLVVWQSQFGPPKSKSNMLTPRTNLLTCWPKVISRVMNGTIFFVCSTSWISRCFPAAIFFQLKSRTPSRRKLRKEGQEKSLWWRIESQWVWYQEVWVGFAYIIQPGEARIGSELCVHGNWEIGAGQSPKPNSEFSSVAQRWQFVSKYK